MTNKKQFIETARLIARESEQVVKMARKVAEACTDKRMKRVSLPLFLSLTGLAPYTSLSPTLSHSLFPCLSLPPPLSFSLTRGAAYIKPLYKKHHMFKC